MLTRRINYAVFSILTIALFLKTCEVKGAKAKSSNGVFQKCGDDARHFLVWFCGDSTFKFPFSFQRIYCKEFVMSFR